MNYASQPQMTIDTTKQYTATIETGKGNLVLELFAKDVPVTVNNFVFLAREGYYDDTTFSTQAVCGAPVGPDSSAMPRGTAPTETMSSTVPELGSSAKSLFDASAAWLELSRVRCPPRKNTGARHDFSACQGLLH